MDSETDTQKKLKQEVRAHLEVCTELFGLERDWRVSALSMTSPPDARRSLSRRPVGPVSTAGMEAVARMASFAKREESDLPACITAEISDSVECKVSWWRSNYSVGIGLWRFWGVNKLGARFVGRRVSQRSALIREFDKEVGERGEEWSRG